MNVEQIVQQTIKPLYVNPKQNILSEQYKQIQNRIKSADQAGFTYQANLLKQKLRNQDQKDEYAEIMQKSGLKILLQRPNFQTNSRLVYPHIVIEQHWRTSAKDLLLVEVPPSKYEGEVPQFAIDATLKAKESNLEPMLWTVMQREHANQSLDPIVVGYLTYKQEPDPRASEMETLREQAEEAVREGNYDVYRRIMSYAQMNYRYYIPSSMSNISANNYCLMIAAWGKDLEAIDSYFQH